jgi:hypothetical protein
MTSVKWLARMTLLGEPFDGYQMRHAYRVRRDEDDPGEPITTIAPRSLMVPPGIPDFLTRARVVTAGPCELIGRAWSGAAEIVAVDLSVDGGSTWASAELGPDTLGRWAWRSWRFEWDARPGEYELCCRARRVRQRATARGALEPRRLRQQRRPASRRHGRVEAASRRASVTHRVGVPGRTTLGAVLAAGVVAATAHGGSTTTATLRLDGAPFRPELALTSAQQQRGLVQEASAEGRDAVRFPARDSRRVLDEEHARPAEDRPSIRAGGSCARF